jgi:hypothetical protein
MDGSDLLSEREVAAGPFRGLISVRTLQTWRRQQRGPVFIKLGRRVVYRFADVLAYIERSSVPTDLPPSAFK